MADTSVAAVNTLSKEATLILLSPLPSPVNGLVDSLITLQLLDLSWLESCRWLWFAGHSCLIRIRFDREPPSAGYFLLTCLVLALFGPERPGCRCPLMG